MRPLLASAALVLAATPLLAEPLTVPSGTYTLDPTHTSVLWKVSHFGMSNYTGRFETVSGELNLDAENPTASTVSVTIDPASIYTGFPFPEQEDFDAKLATSEDWFNTGAHPQITFQSNTLEFTGDTTGTMTGDLTLLGQTQPVTFDVQLNAQHPDHPMNSEIAAVGFSATATIDRTQWGFGTFAPAIGAEVEIVVETEFQHTKADAS